MRKWIPVLVVAALMVLAGTDVLAQSGGGGGGGWYDVPQNEVDAWNFWTWVGVVGLTLVTLLGTLALLIFV